MNKKTMTLEELRSALFDLENPILRVGHMAFAIKCVAESKGIDDAFANALHVIAMQIYEEIQAISETREKLSHSVPEDVTS